MKKSIKSILSLFVAVGLLFSVFTFSSSALGTTIALSSNTININDTLTVTLTFDAGEPFYAVKAVITYDNNILEYESGCASGYEGSLKLVESPSGKTKASYTLTFIAKTAGNAKISVADCYYSEGLTEKPLNGVSANVEVNNQKMISFVAISSFPKKREYFVGEALDLSGGKIAVGYTDATYETFDLEQSMLLNYDTNKTGYKIITVSYKGYVTEFTIKISANSDINNDGKLNASDLILLRQYLLLGNNSNLDINGDGVFDLRDLVHLKKKIANF